MASFSLSSYKANTSSLWNLDKNSAFLFSVVILKLLWVLVSFTGVNECDEHMDGCGDHGCIDKKIGYTCNCKPGYKLANDSKSCLGEY